MIVKLPTGESTCTVDLREFRVHTMTPSAPRGRADCSGIVARALDHPNLGVPFRDVVAGRPSAAVVVPDGTRAAALHQALPAVFERTLAAGVPAQRITVVVATGTHPPAISAALKDLLGPVPEGVRVIQHDCRETRDLVAVGTLETGLQIRLNRAVVEAAIVVTVGAVRHHYFAGFGGGGKLIFPGVAGYEEIQINHSRVVRPDGTGGLQRHPACEPGVVTGNPVAEEIAAAVELHPPGFSLCLVPGNDGRIAHAVGGDDWRAAFDAAVERVRMWYEVPSVPRSPLAVASAGGYPSDATLIQAHKALDAVCRFVEPGGELLFVADLGEGLGSPDMVPFVADPRPEEVTRRLAQTWVQYGHTTLRIVEKTRRFRVHLVSRLDGTVAEQLGFHPVADPADVVQSWRERYAGGAVTVLPGHAVYPRRNTS